ncbi:vWA domain-containing protein [Vineibacter terrae]|uniref:vWA domain-containing protein n=1 Tax=Vineibacter terrae TaxID=2586908 RepID=UPI002E31E6DF|nr:vWA domain-containing protein [Vineibacter terrae]HEX2890175.1 vWA domain-containing protein [Vineibacter terrae]
MIAIARRVATASAVVLAAALMLVTAAVAQQPSSGGRTPLLMEGKKTLFQRVLTRPDAQPFDKPGGTAGAALPPMSALYVYARQTVGGMDWLEVGPGSDGKTTGWLKAPDTVAWRQTLTLAFTNPAGRERALFFRERDKLQGVLEANDRVAQAKKLRDTVVAGGTLPAGFPVISIEPSTHIDISKQFYLLPILEASEAYLSNNIKVRMLRVASVTLKKDGDDPLKPKVRQNLYESLKDFKLGVVFVVDTTTSMQPYLDRARDAARRFYEQIERAGLKASYGLVAFRNNTSITPGLEYLTKVFVQPKDAPDGKAFLEKLKDLKATTVSSHAFTEDSIAGVKAAIDEIDWSGFDGRIVVLITDAGPLQSSDPSGSTGLDVDRIRELAETRKIHLMAVHLRTAAGKNDHASAEGQYKAMTEGKNLPRALYYPVEAGSVAEFGKNMESIAEGATQLMRMFAAGRLQEQQQQQPPPSAGRVQRDFQLIGHAMALAYLGSQNQTQAPKMFEAWATDRDMDTPTSTALEVRVLLTKNQLSDLQQTIRRIVDAGKRGQLTPAGFFDELRSAAAAMSRDPSRIGRRGTEKLGELGLMGEYLDDLPYRSKIMGIDQATWTAWSIAEQQALINELEAKARLYERFHNDAALWVQLGGPGGDPGDAVYPIPLDALP